MMLEQFLNYTSILNFLFLLFIFIFLPIIKFGRFIELILKNFFFTSFAGKKKKTKKEILKKRNKETKGGFFLPDPKFLSDPVNFFLEK